MMITKYDHLPINQEFTEKELNRAIKTMKTGKAPGPDNITYELFNQCWTKFEEKSAKNDKLLLG